MTQWTLVAFGRGKGKATERASTAKGKARDSKDSWDSTDRTGTRARTRKRIRLNVGIVEKVDTTRKTVGSRRTPKVVRKGKHKPKNADAHNLDPKPSIAEPEVEIDEFSMTYLNVNALQESEKVRGSEWIKIGVDTGAGKKDGMASEYHVQNDDSW